MRTIVTAAMLVVLSNFSLAGDQDVRGVLSKNVVIAETVPACVSWNFEAPEHEFPPEEMDWLGKLVSFIFSTKGETRYVAEEPHAKVPVSSQEMLALLHNPRFANFAGPDISLIAKELIEKRRMLESNQHPDPKNKNEESKFQNQDRRIGIQYLNRQSRLTDLAVRRFHLTKTSTALTCD
jgi:hypothetical protein